MPLLNRAAIHVDEDYVMEHVVRLSKSMANTAAHGRLQVYYSPFAITAQQDQVRKELFYDAHPFGDYLQHVSQSVQFDLPPRFYRRGVLFPAVTVLEEGADGAPTVSMHELRPPSYLPGSIADNVLRSVGIGFLGMPRNISGRSGTFAFLLLGLKTFYAFLWDMPNCIVSAEVQNVVGDITDDDFQFTLRPIGDGELKRDACAGMPDHVCAIFDGTSAEFARELAFLEPWGFSFFPRAGYVHCNFSVPMPPLVGYHENYDPATASRGAARSVNYA